MPRILLVDDSRVTREVTKVYLVGRDVTLLDAADGLEALSVIRRERPDVVVADLQMPKLDGPGLCEALRAEPAISKTPVIILTSNRDPGSRDRCLCSGARELLTKPVMPGDLLAAIDRCLGR